MKLADLEQRVIVPITDQTKCGIQYEVEISIEKLLKGSLEDFEPILVDAIPVEWILNKVGDEETYTLKFRHAWGQLVGLWAKEQEG